MIPTVYEIMVETREKIRGEVPQEESGNTSSPSTSLPEPKRRGGARPRPRPEEAVTSAHREVCCPSSWASPMRIPSGPRM